MRLSVVVPVLDEAAGLGATLDAVRAQDGPTEILVVDGGSSDGSLEVAERHGADRLLLSSPGRGIQLDAGARAAGGDALMFLHADCLLPRDAFAHVRETLEDGRWIAGAFRVRHRASDSAGWITRRLVRIADFRSHVTRLPYGDQAPFLSRADYERVGGIPPQPLMEDLEFARRLRRAGRVRVVSAEVRASARRFEARPLRAALAWWTFPLLHRLGVEPERLARWYGAVRAPPRR